MPLADCTNEFPVATKPPTDEPLLLEDDVVDDPEDAHDPDDDDDPDEPEDPDAPGPPEGDAPELPSFIGIQASASPMAFGGGAPGTLKLYEEAYEPLLTEVEPPQL